jgi:N-acyl-D-aspartate/D-glutamate deacylase
VIDNGQVTDPGTMYNAVANVGIKGGKIAVITLFDPKTVTDNATYKAGENGLPSTGIPYVIVNGTIV